MLVQRICTPPRRSGPNRALLCIGNWASSESKLTSVGWHWASSETKLTSVGCQGTHNRLWQTYLPALSRTERKTTHPSLFLACFCFVDPEIALRRPSRRGADTVLARSIRPAISSSSRSEAFIPVTSHAIPESGRQASGIEVESAQAAPAVTFSWKGEPGSSVPVWRSATCSSYIPHRAIE